MKSLFLGFGFFPLTVIIPDTGLTRQSPKPHLSEEARRGRIPKRSLRPELDTVPLCLREKASFFWIILLLVESDPEHPRIKLAAPGMPQKALTNVTGVKRTLLFAAQMSAFGQKRTFNLRRISDLFLYVLAPFEPPCRPVVPFKSSGGSF